MTTEPAETSQASAGRRRREATVAVILDATKQLLASGTPVANLSVERIVTQAGLARATFYLHFRDKREVIMRLADEEVAWREEIGAEVLADPDLKRETLDQIMREITARWIADRHVLSAIIELAESDPVIRATWRDAMHAVAGKAATQFRARWAGSPDRPSDPDTIADVFTWMFERSCHQLLTDPSRAEVVAGAMAEIIWRVIDYESPGAR